jgi:ATP-dependent Clp protease ATP-binding subunit ClpC
MQQTNHLHSILLYAQQEAQRLGSSEILPDHLMLGILRLADGKAFELLMQAGLNPVELKRSIDERLIQSTTSDTTKMSRASERILRLMLIEAKLYHAEECGSVHLLLGLLRERVNYPAMFVEQQFGIDYERIEGLYPKPQPLPQDGSNLESEFAGEQPFEWGTKKEPSNKTSKNGTPALDKYGRDLTAQARNGELDPVVGRQAEIERVVQILSRRKKNNPILIGEPGVGKSAIVEGLALRIESGETESLKGKRMYPWISLPWLQVPPTADSSKSA